MRWNGCSREYNLEENHRSTVTVERVKFDTGLSEMFFTERTLMRTKW